MCYVTLEEAVEIRVCVNGGHCPGFDPGAIGARVAEAAATQALMRAAAVYLRAAGYEVLEVQSNSLREVCALSNAWQADLFVSIHCNAAENAAARGTETFCFGRGSAAERLAVCVQRQVTGAVGTVDRGIKCADFYVLRETDCPAVLVETAFVSNEADEVLLVTRQDEFARATARGVSDYAHEEGR